MRPQPRLNLPAEFLRLGYVLLSRIGEGASAEVWEARASVGARTVALKISRGDLPEAESIAARLQTAWNVGRGLRHPHLVETLDGGTLPGGRAWIAMERLVGRDLQQVLDTEGALKPARAVHLGLQVCEALQVLHRRGAVHRDVKPENVFLTEDGPWGDHARLIDLGVLALASDDPEKAHEDTGRVIMGTPLYLAPELAYGATPDPRADLYSFGALLYHLLAGEPPFPGDDPLEVVQRHVNEPVRPLSTLVSALPSSLVDIVHRCLDKDPLERPESVAEVLVQLERAAEFLAGGFDSISLRQARIPAVPAAGILAEWRHLAAVLQRNVTLLWVTAVPPDDVSEALAWVQDSVEVLDRSLERRAARRERADALARKRIESQTRLLSQRRALMAATAAARLLARELHTRLERALARRAEIDQMHRAALQPFADVGERAIEGFDPIGLTRLHGPVRTLLAARNEVDQDLKLARAEERDAAEQLALLLAEEVEVDAALAELRLEEHDVERRLELLADEAADEVLVAQRALENASLKLFLAFTRAVVRLGGAAA